MDVRFLEIEHKFVVPESFDLGAFEASLLALGPEKHYRTEVLDTYYLVKAVPGIVYRHRHDNLIQQLSAKSLGDNEVRLEVNLELDQDKGYQGAQVEAFLKPLGIMASATLKKDVRVFYFERVEIVHYVARYENEIIRCVEIEARHPSSLEAAKQELKDWEERLGLDPKVRSKASLLHLLVLPRLPESLRQLLAMSESTK